MISQLQLQLQYKYSTLVHLIEVHINIMRTLVYGHIHVCVMYAVVSPPAAPVLPLCVVAAVSAELVPGDSTGWRMRCVNNKIHIMIPHHPSPPSFSRHNRKSVEICAETQRVRVEW